MPAGKQVMFQVGFFLVLSHLFIASLFAQNGNISGIVKDSSGRGVLVGAQVRVEGQTVATTTDDSGRYLLLGLPVGPARVSVSYLGLATSTMDAAVSAGDTAALDFTLSPAGITEELTVTATPELVGQARALNDQLNSLTLVNIVASDQIGSFPDPNAAEATQRLPGIIVQRDQGEGRYVLIRGTEPRLSSTTIDGERIGSTESASRQIPLDTIPADLMGAIEIAKVLTPDMDADSIGGRINLVTKRAPATPHLSATIGTGFNALVKDDIKNYNASYGQTLFGDKLGFILSGNYYQNNRGSQDLEPAFNANQTLNSLDLRDYVLTRTRKGGVWDLDYKLGSGSQLYFRGLRTQYDDEELRHRFRNLTANGRLERLLRDRTHNSNQTALSLGASHTLPRSVLFSWRTSYSKATLLTPYRLESTFRQTGVTFAPNVTAGSIDPSNVQANPTGQNLNNFNFIQNAIQNDRGYERNISGNFDFSVPSRFGSNASGVLKFGVKVRDENRTRDVQSITQTPPSGLTIKLMDNINTDYSPADEFLDGKYSDFGKEFPDRDKMRMLSHSTTLLTVISPTGDSGSYRAKERVSAGYVMEEISLGERTTIMPGVRIEQTQTTYSAPQYVTTGGNVASRTVVPGSHDYTNVLPGIHLRHEVFDDTPLRISYARTLARPNYSDLAPFVLQDSTGLTISKGNPNLQVTMADNVDVNLEHYFQNVGIASAGFFYKHLNNYIYSTTLQENIGPDLYRVTQPINGDTAKLYGLELTFVKHLDFLPGPLNGLAVYTNYTHVHSDATLPRGASVLPGQASNMGNASISYEKRGFSSRVSFNRQGRYILAIGGDPASDNWLDDRTEIDFSASHSINKHVRLFVDMLNLGNQPYRVYVGDANHALQEERYKMWAIMGLKLDF